MGRKGYFKLLLCGIIIVTASVIALTPKGVDATEQELVVDRSISVKFNEQREQVTAVHHERLEAERLRIEAEQKAAEEKAKVEQAAREAEEKARAEEAERVRIAQAKAQTPAETPKKATASKTEPAKSNLIPNSIGINGNYKKFSNGGIQRGNYENGRDYTNFVQRELDAGKIVTTVTKFSGSDGEMTWFGGHNPGVFNYMATSVRIGSIIDVVDSNGVKHSYKMVDRRHFDDKTRVELNGDAVLTGTNRTATSAYSWGTGVESILVQFCINNDLILFYGLPVN